MALSAAVRDSPDQLFHDVEALLPQHFPVRSAWIALKAADKWTYWDSSSECADHLELSIDATGAILQAGSSIRLTDRSLFFAIRAGDVGLIVDEIESGAANALSSCAIYLEAVLSGMKPASTSLRQKIITAFSRVATTILHSDDLTEIFFNITEVAKSELAVDISGIMLLEDERLVMQRCVGKASPRTTELSMAVGQGIGGPVVQRRADHRRARSLETTPIQLLRRECSGTHDAGAACISRDRERATDFGTKGHVAGP